MIGQTIASINNSTIKYVKQLKTKKAREKYNQYVIDGLRIVKHALETCDCLEYILVTQEFLDSDNYKSISLLLENVKIYIITKNIMNILVETETPQGIIAVVNKKVSHSDYGSILILDRVQDPGNIGTLIRTADAAGFDTIILVKGCTDPYSQKALRSSMGSIMSMNIVNSNDIIKDINYLKLKGYSIYSAALEGGNNFREVVFTDKKALVIGNEANGISNEILSISSHKIYIPMTGDVESLNASIAGGILMFEMNK